MLYCRLGVEYRSREERTCITMINALCALRDVWSSSFNDVWSTSSKRVSARLSQSSKGNASAIT